MLLLILFCLLNFIFSIPIEVTNNRHNKFIIGESSYLNNDFFMAEYIFKDLLSEKIIDQYTANSIEKLFSIAEKMGDAKLFKDMHTYLQRIDKIKAKDFTSDSLNYTLGKIFFHQGFHQTAFNYLKEIKAESKYYPQGIYLIATSSSIMNKHQTALILFDRITSMQNISSYMRDISTLAKARVLMLLNRQDEALIEYQKINIYSPFFVKAVKETVWIFIENKNFDLALSLLETLSFVNKSLYFKDENIIGSDFSDTLSSFDLMSLKNTQGDIYLQQGRFNDALHSFNEVLTQYDLVKKTFKDELNRLKLSDDLSQIISHTTEGGVPRSLITNFKSNFFYNFESYALVLREWTTQVEKDFLEKTFNMYYAMLKEVIRVNQNKNKTNQDLKIIDSYTKLNRGLKRYLDVLIKTVYLRLDEIGLKAQLGLVDLVWKIKDDQSMEILKIQTMKQDFSDAADEKFKGLIK